MVAWRTRQPAFKFASPVYLRQLFLQRGAASFVRGQVEQAEISQRAPAPPGHQTRVIVPAGSRINPRPVLADPGAAELIEEWQLQAVGEITPAFELPQKFLHVGTGDDDDNRGLHFAGGLGQQFKTPYHLRHGPGGEFLHLQFHHRLRLGGVALGQLDDAQKDLVGGQPGDVQLGPEQRLPILADNFGGQRFGGPLGLLPLEGEFSRELPKLVNLAARLEYVAGMPARHLNSSPAFRCGRRPPAI